VCASCSDGAKWKFVELPALPDKPVQLRVAYVDNDRFKGVDDAQIRSILDRTRQLVKQHFDIDISFSQHDHISIQDFFSNLKQTVKRARDNSMLVSGKLSAKQRLRLRDSIYKTLERYWNDRELVTDFARPYLENPLPEDDFHKLADSLVETLLIRLEYSYQQQADDGRPVLDGSPYNEWVWWDSLGYGNVPYDVVITNQLVASAEYYGMDVHSSLRGGITAGTTTYSKSAQFGTFSWIMLYPMLNDNEVLARLRDDAHYSPGEVTEYAANLLTHELGHLLLHLGHPFGNHNCVMAPTPLLKYRQWVDGLNPALCQLNSEEQMVPGVAKIEYHTEW
jgi:hypothetical protein